MSEAAERRPGTLAKIVGGVMGLTGTLIRLTGGVIIGACLGYFAKELAAKRRKKPGE